MFPPEQQLKNCIIQPCQMHCFQIRQTQQNGTKEFDFKKGYCPKLQHYSQQFRHIIPFYNMDLRQYSPGFVLPYYKDEYAQYDMRNYNVYQDSISQQFQQKAQFFLRLPDAECFNCAICEQYDIDYFEHIQQTRHKVNIKKNKFNHYILNLCKKFRNNLIKKKKVQQGQQSQYQSQQQSVFIQRGEVYGKRCLQYNNNTNNKVQQIDNREKQIKVIKNEEQIVMKESIWHYNDIIDIVDLQKIFEIQRLSYLKQQKNDKNIFNGQSPRFRLPDNLNSDMSEGMEFFERNGQMMEEQYNNNNY